MNRSDPIFDAVAAPGSPFEIGDIDERRYFVNAPASLGQLVESARRHGDMTFLVEGERRLSFADFFVLRDALANALAIAPGERVAICMRNRIEWLTGFLAVIRAGGVAVLLNSRGSPAELAAAVADVRPALVLADSQRAALLRAGGYAGRLLEADDFPVEAAVFTPPAPAAPDDAAAILFTSGTSGRVKGAILSHRNIITGVLGMQMAGMMVLHNTAAAMGVSPETLIAAAPQQVVLMVYPLFHISGLGASFLSPLLAGSKVVILPKWEAEAAAQVIADEGVTMFAAVPTMLWDMLHRARLADADLSSLRNIGTGGQALPINLLDAMREMCPNAVMGTGYGLTETAGSVSMAVGDDFIRNRAAAGRVLPLIDLRIESPDGQVQPTGVPGEIVVRGAQVMQGYWERPDDTARALDAGGWLHTGDIGYLDDDGYLFIVDRMKDMVISGGENIYCAEVERILSEIDGIGEAACFGIPDERLGELLVAVVVGGGLTAEEVKHIVGERLARYKAPAHVSFTDQPLPRNDVGKIDKTRLRAAWPTLAKEKT